MSHLPKALVILTPGFPKDEKDSTCLPAQQLFVKAVNRQYPGLRLIILSFEYPFSKAPYEWQGNKVIPFDGWNKGRTGKVRTWMEVWRMLNSLEKNYDLLGLLSFWCTGCALVGNYYARRHGLRHLIWILGQDARAGNRYIPLIRPKAGDLVAMSDSLAREFQKQYSITPQHIVPNGIDDSLYQPGPAVRDIDILGAGSLIPLKQFDLFLSIVRRLSDTMPGIRAVICGKGPEELRLREAIRKGGLEERVILAGEQPHDKVLQYMQRSRILLHTSFYEGFSTVCLEALYAGAHVVSFHQPLPTAVPHWHIAADREEMAKQVLDVLQDNDTEYSKVLLFSMDGSARSMIGLFGYLETASC
jgi:glycosyltransferase involved in cell wall biosynthesis